MAFTSDDQRKAVMAIYANRRYLRESKARGTRAQHQHRVRLVRGATLAARAFRDEMAQRGSPITGVRVLGSMRTNKKRPRDADVYIGIGPDPDDELAGFWGGPAADAAEDVTAAMKRRGYRVDVVPIKTPSLAELKKDIKYRRKLALDPVRARAELLRGRRARGTLDFGEEYPRLLFYESLPKRKYRPTPVLVTRRKR